MAQAVIMPRQGQSVESCILTEIVKKEGESVSAGEILFSCETDKATFEVEAEISGTVLKWLAEEGDDVPVLDNVCIIGEAGEDITALLTAEDSPKANEDKTEQQAPQEQPVVQAAPAASAQAGEALKVSPRARNMAENQKVDLTKTTPTGPEGRIIARDVAAAAAAGYKTNAAIQDSESEKRGRAAANQVQIVLPTAGDAEFTDEKLSNVRKKIAGAMHASLAEMAQLTLNASFDASALLTFREQVKHNGEAMGLGNITLNDMVLFAVAKTLKKHAACNAHFLGDKIRYFQAVNLGVAVDTDRGLLVPTIFDAGSYSLNDLSAVAKQTVAQAKTGNISPDLLKDGTFTVTNLGALGVESFTPVINPPQTCILGVCAITEKVKMVGGQMTAYPSMGLSLTFDHRALDGAPAARFLKDLADSLESFSLLLI